MEFPGNDVLACNIRGQLRAVVLGEQRDSSHALCAMSATCVSAFAVTSSDRATWPRDAIRNWNAGISQVATCYFYRFVKQKKSRERMLGCNSSLDNIEAIIKASATKIDNITLDTTKGFVTDMNGVTDRLPIDRYLLHM
jgi:hypothetical protein